MTASSIIRIVLLAAGVAHAVFAQAPATASDSVEAALRSGDAARVTQAIRELEKSLFVSVGRARAALEASVKQPSTIKRQLMAQAARAGEPAGAMLDELARSGDTGLAIAVLRVLPKAAPEQARKTSRALLDAADRRVASEATKGLFTVATPADDAFMLKRAEALRTAALAGDEKAAHHYGDTLYYLGSRPELDAYALLFRGFREGPRRARNVGRTLLTSRYGDRARQDIRTRASTSDAAEMALFMQLVLESPLPRDRGLAFVGLKPDDPRRKALGRLHAATSTWCGIAAPRTNWSSTKYRLRMQNLRSGAKREFRRETTATRPDADVLKVIDFETPLGHLLSAPQTWDFSREKTEEGETWEYRVRSDQPLALRVGIGSAGLGVWYGRFNLRITRATTRVSKAGFPISTSAYNAKGQATTTIRYEGRIKGTGDQWVPKRVSITTPRARFVVHYSWHASGVCLPLRAEAFLAGPNHKAGVELPPLSVMEIDKIETGSEPKIED